MAVQAYPAGRLHRWVGTGLHKRMKAHFTRAFILP
jgi:hypothetical protein